MTIPDAPPALPLSYRRRPTRRVLVGRVGLGADEPVRVQSMCTTDTGNTEATALQAFRLAEAGCEIVRVTVPNLADAHALEPLRRRLEELGVTVPLVADIHFNPHAAMIAADTCEKVRINPGNYADAKKFAVREYTDAEYGAELERIAEKLAPLIEKCKRLGRAMRIGTNHGSLSDRIMNRYGDSALGMVESALEFVRICERHDYRDLVISMKSSNPFVAVQAYRLLARRMEAEGMDYPFHLGVTEAGDGEDGRVKSAIGIGALLADGIGDTVRVSLTEDPVREVPVAFALVAPYNASQRRGATAPRTVPSPTAAEGTRRATDAVALGARGAGGSWSACPWVALGAPSEPSALAPRVRELVAAPGSDAPLADVGFLALESAQDMAALDAVRPALWAPEGRFPLAVKLGPELVSDESALRRACSVASHVMVDLAGLTADRIGAVAREVVTGGASFGLWVEAEPRGETDDPERLDRLARHAVAAVAASSEATGALPLLAIATPAGESPVFAIRRATRALAEADLPRVPLLLVDRAAELGADRALLETATRLGGLLVDGMGDAILVVGAPPAEALARTLGVLQATRLRMTRPDYISCPSCGRTLFDLEEVTARIKRATGHLKGVKIAIMGCIVNGPGEMADADFGYVGSAPGKINLYVGKDCVAKNIPAEEADDRLIALIRQSGRWIDSARDEAAATAERPGT